MAACGLEASCGELGGSLVDFPSVSLGLTHGFMGQGEEEEKGEKKSHFMDGIVINRPHLSGPVSHLKLALYLLGCFHEQFIASPKAPLPDRALGLHIKAFLFQEVIDTPSSAFSHFSPTTHD